MHTYLIYNRNTRGQGQMEELSNRLNELHVGHELVDADTPRGIELAAYYDVLARPAVLVARSDDGSLMQMWTDSEQISPDEISYFAHQ